MTKKRNETLTSSQRPANNRVVIDQATMPRIPLEESISIAKCLVEEFAGAPTAPHDIAMALDTTPTSSRWQRLTGASIAYGLTSGGYNAKMIALTDLGRRIANADRDGIAEAVMRPKVLAEFFKRYDRQKFPSDSILPRVLQGLGVPTERLAEASVIVRQNGMDAGLIRHIKTGLFVALASASKPDSELPVESSADDLLGNLEPAGEIEPETMAQLRSGEPKKIPATEAVIGNRKVFISHGRDRTIVGQLKEILTFGKFEPVVSVERETTAVPVPAKVFADMRDCAAGIIHVMAEGQLLDSSGNTVQHINDNVLIEVGAAMALFGRQFILLVEKGTSMPSNLQGLYRCEYEGDRLDYEATMKLLKTFNEFDI